LREAGLQEVSTLTTRAQGRTRTGGRAAMVSVKNARPSRVWMEHPPERIRVRLEATITKGARLRGVTVTVEVKSYDADVRAKREATASSVVREFGGGLPDLKLLAFFDDGDDPDIRRDLGPANRGFHAPIKENRPTTAWPLRMTNLIFVPVDGSPFGRTRRVFDNGIYVHGSTCTDETALIMTFAHELQHFVQYGFSRRLWAEGGLIP
jgi:hypothetical protein